MAVVAGRRIVERDELGDGGHHLDAVPAARRGAVDCPGFRVRQRLPHHRKMRSSSKRAALGEQWELPAKIIHVIRHGRPQDITPQDTGEDRIVALAQGMLSRQSFVKGNSELSYREEKYRLCLSSDSITEVGEMFDSQKSYLDSIITSIAC